MSPFEQIMAQKNLELTRSVHHLVSGTYGSDTAFLLVVCTPTEDGDQSDIRATSNMTAEDTTNLVGELAAGRQNARAMNEAQPADLKDDTLADITTEQPKSDPFPYG